MTFQPKTAKTGKADIKYSDEDLKLSLDYANYIVKTSVNEIKEGKADALVSPGYHYCGICPYAGACGNVPSRPSDRLENKKAGDVYADYLEKGSEISGKPAHDKDGSANNNSMKEAYKIMMRERLGENENNDGGEE